MASYFKSSVLSSIRIEPVYSDDYIQNLVEKITSYHKQTFLQYIRNEPNILNSPESCPKLYERLVNELNKQELKCKQNEWLSILRVWKDLVKNHSTTKFSSTEDQELSELMMQSTNGTSKSNALKELSTHCRICLASSSSRMLYLFKESNQNHDGNNEVTLLHKLNYCSCFTIKASVDDHLPQYVCMSCSILVENAYQLKVLCDNTEGKFHELSQKCVEQKDNEERSHEMKIEIDRPKARYKNTVENLDLHEVYIEHVENTETEAIKHIKGRQFNHQSVNEITPKRDDDTSEIGDANEKIQEVKVNAKREYHCDVCTAVFSTKQRLNEHMEKNHKLDVVRKKSYQCAECDKWFRVKCSLTIHLRTHTGERPYTCEICGKSFKTSSAANNHRIVHSDAKDFKCSACPFTTNTKANLSIHSRTHTGVQPYTCQFCPMKFRTASNVVKHVRNIHEKQKTNKCDKCDRSFFTRESLRKHSIIHTGLKPFNCPADGCSHTFGWYNGLKKHIRHQHSDENVRIPSEKYFYDKLKDILPATS